LFRSAVASARIAKLVLPPSRPTPPCVEQPESARATKEERRVRDHGHEALQAERGVAEHLQELRAVPRELLVAWL